ncbi:MAG: NUDIX hydrolase [Actinomycetota bacterium]|nr:NUDIX hydrolase [Actinomycetota bacterium]
MQPDSSRIAFDGKQIKVAVERWGEREREIVEHPGAVAIVAVDREGYVTLVRQLREPARKVLLELPAGTIEANEEPIETAKRELAEEAGLSGGDWREAAAFYTSPGFCNERMTVFFAENLELGEQHPAGDEEIELVRVPAGDLAGLLEEIEDAKTLAGLLLYLRGR